MGGSAGAQHRMWLSSGESASMVCQVTRNWEEGKEASHKPGDEDNFRSLSTALP